MVRALDWPSLDRATQTFPAVTSLLATCGVDEEGAPSRPHGQHMQR